MSGSDDDPIAEAILSSDPDKRTRYEGWALLGQYDLPTKLRAAGALCGVTAAVVFGLALVRGATLDAILGEPLLRAAVSGSVMLATGLQFVTLGTVGLLLVGLRRRVPDLSDNEVERLVGVEETAALLAFGTGGMSILVSLAVLVVMAVTDPARVPGWVANFATPMSLPVPYGVLGWWAALLSGVALGGSLVFEDP